MNKLIIYLFIFVAFVVWVGAYFTLNGQRREVKPNDVQGGTHEIHIANNSKLTISHGVLVIHSDKFSMNFLGGNAPPEYENLAEVGDPSDLVASIENNPEVYAIIKTDPISPDDVAMIYVSDVDEKMSIVSYMAMIVETNDGVAWLNNVPLYDEGGRKTKGAYFAEVLDMGTEENTPIGSGFAGGQPDLSRGKKNIDNGTPTSDTVKHHPQFADDSAQENMILQFNFIPQSQSDPVSDTL